jgi:predicted ATP-dependent endonuclease of OLD family
MLIDEPDAFLHPPLARRLGANMVTLSQEKDASLIVATHSGDFLMGCLEADPFASIVRLTYENNIATARSLEPSDLRYLMNDPLLRSTAPLRGLFHRGAIVTEADTDRAFYDEINQRLLNAGRGIREGLFLNAQNKDTVHKLVDPLRKIGIPTAAIVDLDFILLVNQTSRKNLFDACQVEYSTRNRINAEMEYLSNEFNKMTKLNNKDRIKTEGIFALKKSALQ